MGKSLKSLDVMDTVSYLLSMDQMSKLSTIVMLVPGGSSTAPSCSIHLLSTALSTTPWDDLEVFRTVSAFPNANAKTFEGGLFRSVVDHDAAYSREVFLRTTSR